MRGICIAASTVLSERWRVAHPRCPAGTKVADIEHPPEINAA
jgi:hypothetical protein